MCGDVNASLSNLIVIVHHCMCLHSQYDENACSYIDSVCQIHMWHVVHVRSKEATQPPYINIATCIVYHCIVMCSYVASWLLYCMLCKVKRS